MEGIKSLNLFFDTEPSEKFLQDLDNLKKIEEKEIFEIINFIIENYPKDIDKAWEEYSKELGEAQKETKLSVLRIFLFILIEYASGNINKEELKKDFGKLELSEKYFNHIIEKLKNAEDFCEKASARNQPYKNKLDSVEWRIDKQNIGSDFEKTIAAIEFNYYSKGEKQTTQIDLDSEELKKVIAIFNKIEKRL